jgi:hypothetical protein
VWVSDWSCPEHGAVHPLLPPHAPTHAWLDDVAARSRVPVWMLWPLPTGWLFTGLAEAGSERTGPQATVVACSGPNPAPRPEAPAERPADLLLVAEVPGVGLGAHLAGLDDVDPGSAVGQGPAHATVRADGHASSLWLVDGAPDRATYVGEAGGVWLYLVLWPATAGVLLAEPLHLQDVRGMTTACRPPSGAPSARLP